MPTGNERRVQTFSLKQGSFFDPGEGVVPCYDLALGRQRRVVLGSYARSGTSGSEVEGMYLL
jgi:hypothetical protein